MLTQIINPFRTIPFNMKDQFGLAYGGLRGAISFALAFTLPDNIGRKQLFVTATIAIILFTVFLQVRKFWVTFKTFYAVVVINLFFPYSAGHQHSTVD